MLARALLSGRQGAAELERFRGGLDLWRGRTTSFSGSALDSGFGCLEGGAAVTILGLLDWVFLEFR